MNKVFNKYFDETYYKETLDNGLNVIIFHKPEFNTTVCAFGTPYGALKINEKFNNKEYHFNPGIAHFLEHKLFETKGDDIMSEFSRLGANVNAFTSYKETVYYFSKTGEDIGECLNLLIDFVQNLNITDKSVEKEKGIIAQELSMYKQMPDQKLLQETYRCLYHNYPIKFDIGGDKKSVYKITKDELEECYRINYHPSNMLLCISTPLDPQKVIKLIRNNQKNKKFNKANRPVLANKAEPLNVVKKRSTIKADINTAKHVLAYKINPDFKDNKDAFKKEWALRMLFDACFTSLNPNYQKWLDSKLINDYFGYDIDFDIDCAYILFYIENNDANVLPKLINENLNSTLLCGELIEQLKRRYIGIMFDCFNDIESFNNGYIRDYLQGLDFFDEMKILQSITYQDVIDIFNNVDFSNKTYVSLIQK